MSERLARRRYQSGSVILKNGNWRGRYLEDVSGSDGQIVRVHRSVFLGTKKEIPTQALAHRRLEPFLAKINDYDYRPKQTIRFSEFVAKWETVSEPQYKPGTWRNFQSALRTALIPQFGTSQLDEIRTEALQSFISQQTCGPAHVRNIVKCLRAIWKSARAWKYVENDPFVGLVLPRLQTKQARCFSVEELTAIINAADEPDRTLYYLAAQTGLRIGELLALHWSDIDLDRGTLRVQASVWRGKLQSPKSAAANRTLAISGGLRDHLQRFQAEVWRANDAGLLFTTSTRAPCKADNLLSYRLRPLLSKLGIPHGGFHAFRHANATLLDRINAPMKLRQERMGHSKIEITLGLYTHAEDGREIAEKFDEILSPQN